MKTLTTAVIRALLTVAVLLWIIALATPALGRGSHAVSKDGHSLILYGDGRVPVASIVRTTRGAGASVSERIAIAVEPAHRYQWATLNGAGYRSGSSIARQYIELRSEALADRAAERQGWRNTATVDSYGIRIARFVGLPRPDGVSYLEVLTDVNRTGFVLVITTVLHPDTDNRQPTTNKENP